MPTIVVNSLREITLDGVPAGSIIDVCRNYTQAQVRASDLAAAVDVWFKAHDAAVVQQVKDLKSKTDAETAKLHTAHARELEGLHEAHAKIVKERDDAAARHALELTAARDAADAEHHEKRADAESAHAERLKAANDVIAAHGARIAELEAAFGGTEAGQRAIREKRRADALAAKAAAESALRELDGVPTPVKNVRS